MARCRGNLRVVLRLLLFLGIRFSIFFSLWLRYLSLYMCLYMWFRYLYLYMSQLARSGWLMPQKLTLRRRDSHSHEFALSGLILPLKYGGPTQLSIASLFDFSGLEQDVMLQRASKKNKCIYRLRLRGSATSGASMQVMFSLRVVPCKKTPSNHQVHI